MYQLILESLLGLRRSGNHLRVRPLLPRDWSGFGMRYRHGESSYEITCRRAGSAAAARVTVDSIAAADGSIVMVDDGKSHVVVVDVWRDPQSPQA